MGGVREFLSKSIAGGLSAGVVLLWWPVLFDDVDTVTSWFVRGVAWTLCFELLLVALIPFERALWETSRGERIARRVGDAGSRLHSGPPEGRIRRVSAVASLALAIPVVLVLAGLSEHVPARAEAPKVRPINVVRVTKVVRPVTVQKVVERAPISGQPIVTTPVARAGGARPRAAAHHGEDAEHRPDGRRSRPPRLSATPRRRRRRSPVTDQTAPPASGSAA